MKSMRFLAVICGMLLLVNSSLGQESAHQKQYPSVVLVQLRSEHNRISALTKARRYSEAARVENDAEEVVNRMHLDFHNNFSYCPVYYYIDTNADLVKDRKFDGILLDEDGKTVNHVIDPGDSSYVIAYYGRPLSQAKYHKVQKDDTDHLTLDEMNQLQAQSAPGLQTNTLPVADRDPPSGKGLVILNDKFQQLTYFYKVGYDEILFDLKKRKLKKYYYKSKHYDIEYYPFAGLFSDTMLDRYGRRRITTSPGMIKR